MENKVSTLIAKMNGSALVIDGITDATETATSIQVMPLALVVAEPASPSALALATITITDPAIIRALYNHPSASAYGDGSYTVRGDVTEEEIRTAVDRIYPTYPEWSIGDMAEAVAASFSTSADYVFACLESHLFDWGYHTERRRGGSFGSSWLVLGA